MRTAFIILALTAAPTVAFAHATNEAHAHPHPDIALLAGLMLAITLVAFGGGVLAATRFGDKARGWFRRPRS